ncbi:MAG: BON domain-containing protein [Mariniblastus sp.]
MSVFLFEQTETNEHFAHRVKDSLLQHGYPQLSQVSCEANDETIVLRGELNSFYLAQIAQSIVRNVPGVREVINKVKVK